MTCLTFWVALFLKIQLSGHTSIQYEKSQLSMKALSIHTASKDNFH